MENNVFINDDDVIEIQVSGDQTKHTVATMGEKIERCIQQLKLEAKPALLLDDVRTIQKVTTSGRSAVVELGKKLSYDKLAFLGRPGIMRLGANLIFRAIGKSGQMHYFEDRDKAIKWLKH